MPFIDPDFLLNETQPVNKLLFTCADDANVRRISFEVAKILEQKGNSVLWVDGNLGEKNSKNNLENQTLDRIILGQIPLTEAIDTVGKISVLTGKAQHTLAELSDNKQYQFLQDLKNIYPNFDKVVLCVDGKNWNLQKKWIKETENIYLLFNTKNLLLNRTVNWLNENPQKAKGLIGIGKNDQEVLLAYMRLKEILGDVPGLILDIKKIAP